MGTFIDASQEIPIFVRFFVVANVSGEKLVQYMAS